MVGDEIRSFSFLNEQFIVVALLIDADPHAFDNEFLEPILAVVNFREEPSERHAMQQAEHVFVFQYPSLTADTIPIRFEIRSDPAPGWFPNSNIQVPFFTSQHNRLYAVSLRLLVGNHLRCIMLFAPLSTFLECIQRKDTPIDRRYEWSTWGPGGTRILLPRTHPSDVWVCYVNGSRYVALRKDKKRFTVDVYDFNRQGLLRAMNQDSDTAISDSYVTKASTFDEGTIFESEVETSLPYRIQSLPLDLKSITRVAVICSEDNIIIVDVRVFTSFFFLSRN